MTNDIGGEQFVVVKPQQPIEQLPVDQVDIQPVLPFPVPKGRLPVLSSLLNGDIQTAQIQAPGLQEAALSAYINKLLAKIDPETKVDTNFLKTEPFATLVSHKSFKANPYWPVIAERLRKVVSQHRLRDGTNPVIGVVLYGSAWKGYWAPWSDIDGKIITSARSSDELTAAGELDSTLRDLFPGEFDVNHVSPNEGSSVKMAGKNNWLLTGLFVGDYSRFQQLQRDYFARKGRPDGESEWQQDQRQIATQGISVEKLFERWDQEWINKYGEPKLTTDQRLILRGVLALQKVPPPPEELNVIPAPLKA